MARAQATLDPAADAAALLRRLGFATLMLFVPLAALLTRRGIVVLVPVGVVLLVLAAALDGLNRPAGEAARRTLGSPATLGALVLLAWCALSLVWTPFVADAAERLLNIAGAVAVAVTGYLALPDRMRSANLYILPVGLAGAALLAIMLGLFGWPAGWGGDEGAQNLQRGLVVLVLLLWPALAWLRSRRREREAWLLAALVAAAVLCGRQLMPLFAFGVGAVIYGVTALDLRRGVQVTAGVCAGLIALAPVIPLLMRPILSGFTGSGAPALRSLRIWREVIVTEPVRVVTGHGFESALRGRYVGLLAADAPTTLLFEVWYDLGLVGAFAGAFALYAAVTGAGRQHAVLVPGMMAAFAAAFAFACLGIGTALMWWFTGLSALVLVFVACERGQFRTRRPKARLLRAANDA